MAEAVRTDRSAEETTEFVGKIGLVGVIGLAVVLAVHPFGTSDLYNDGVEFIDHVNWFWLTLHVVGALLFLSWPPVIGAWAQRLTDARARVVGGWAHTTSVAGVAVGTLHLVGTDTMTFWAFKDTFEESRGSEAAQLSVDVLLRLHAATLVSWTLIFFLAVPLLAGVASLLDGRYPRWVGYVGVVGGALQVPALIITLSERQWTTLSEQLIFRTGVTLFVVFMLAIAWSLKRGAPVGTPVPVVSSHT